MGVRKTSFDERKWNMWVAKSPDGKRSWFVYEKCGWTIQAVEGPDGKRAWLIAAPDGYSYLHMTNRGRNEAMDFADMRIREQEKANDQPA